MLSRAPDPESEPFYSVPVGTMPPHVASVPWSQPTSPTPPSRNFAGQLSPTNAAGAAAVAAMAGHRLTYPKKNDEGMNRKQFTEILIFQSNISYF